MVTLISIAAALIPIPTSRLRVPSTFSLVLVFFPCDGHSGWVRWTLRMVLIYILWWLRKANVFPWNYLYFFWAASAVFMCSLIDLFDFSVMSFKLYIFSIWMVSNSWQRSFRRLSVFCCSLWGQKPLCSQSHSSASDIVLCKLLLIPTFFRFPSCFLLMT